MSDGRITILNPLTLRQLVPYHLLTLARKLQLMLQLFAIGVILQTCYGIYVDEILRTRYIM